MTWLCSLGQICTSEPPGTFPLTVEGAAFTEPPGQNSRFLQNIWSTSVKDKDESWTSEQNGSCWAHKQNIPGFLQFQNRCWHQKGHIAGTDGDLSPNSIRRKGPTASPLIMKLWTLLAGRPHFYSRKYPRRFPVGIYSDLTTLLSVSYILPAASALTQVGLPGGTPHPPQSCLC